MCRCPRTGTRGTAILRRLIDVMYWLLPLTLRFLRGFHWISGAVSRSAKKNETPKMAFRRV
jgi:hypothetical protein